MSSFQVQTIPPSVWKPYTENYFSKLPAEAARTAHVLLTTMHNRHIGLTPQLAADLAPIIQNPSAPSEWWQEIFARLAAELKGSAAGFVPSASPLFTIKHIAQPIIELACRNLGRSYLFHQDQDHTNLETAQYHKYTKDLRNEVLKLARTQDTSIKLFWRMRAYTLASQTHDPRGALEERPLPNPDPRLAALLWDLPCEMPPVRRPPKRTKHSHARPDRRASGRREEGGYEGIRVTRRPENLGRMLISEFLNHPVVFADRLLNSGYLIHRRMPKRERPRDLLLTGLLPPALSNTPIAPYLKAIWFELVVNLAWILCNKGLIKSEFRWIEGNANGQVRHHSFLLQDMPFHHDGLGENPTRAFRNRFIHALGWFPEFADQRAPWLDLAAPSNQTHQWTRQAWSQVQDNPRWRRHQDQSQAKPNLAFDHTHLMLFLPADSTPPPTSHFGPPGSAPNHSALLVPENLNASSQWRHHIPGSPNQALFPDAGPNWTAPKISGRITGALLNQMIREIWRV